MSYKDEIRAKMRVKRRYLQESRREINDEMMAATFFENFSKYESFLIYCSTGGEASTKEILRRLIQSNKRVYMPRVEGKDIVCAPYGELKRGAYGILEPQGEAYNGGIDVVLVPLLAINAKGYRIGYGGGYYDRYLKDNPAVKVGLGYYFQIENFAEDEWDIPLEYFLCERGLYDFGKSDF